MAARSGLLLVLSGPSGAGKGAIAAGMLERDRGLWRSVSITTRQRRTGEIDGVDYLFVTPEEFEAIRERGGCLECFEVFGHWYGTPREPVVGHLATGQDVLLEIDVQGAMAVREAYPDAVLIFVRPPSRAVQRARLERRGQDSPETIERRLARADSEEAAAERFDGVVINDDLGQAIDEVAAIVEAHRAP